MSKKNKHLTPEYHKTTTFACIAKVQYNVVPKSIVKLPSNSITFNDPSYLEKNPSIQTSKRQVLTYTSL